MSNPNDNFEEQLLLVLGLFGGITFTGLVLVLSFPIYQAHGSFYFQSIVTLLAVACAASLFASVGTLQGRRNYRAPRNLGKFQDTMLFIMIIGILVILPAIVSPFSNVAAILVVIFELLALGVDLTIIRKNRRKK